MITAREFFKLAREHTCDVEKYWPYTDVVEFKGTFVNVDLDKVLTDEHTGAYYKDLSEDQIRAKIQAKLASMVAYFMQDDSVFGAPYDGLIPYWQVLEAFRLCDLLSDLSTGGWTQINAKAELGERDVCQKWSRLTGPLSLGSMNRAHLAAVHEVITETFENCC